MPGMIVQRFARKRLSAPDTHHVAPVSDRCAPPRRSVFLALLAVILAPHVSQGVSAAGPPPRPGPRRIITIAPNSAEIICAIGACDRIVGVTKYCRYPPELQSRPTVGGLIDPNLERIVALRPDLIVLRGRNEAIESLSRERGIEIYRDEIQSLSDIERTTTDLGRRLGLEAGARMVITDMRRRLDAIRRRVKDRPKPRVLLTTMRKPDSLSNLLTTGPGTFLDEMIETAGGTNIFGDLDMRYPQVSLEAILAKRPEVIIELVPEIELTPELERNMRAQWQAIGPIPAVATHRIYYLPDDHALIPSPRHVEVVEKVSRLLHPETSLER